MLPADRESRRPHESRIRAVIKCSRTGHRFNCCYLTNIAQQGPIHEAGNTGEQNPQSFSHVAPGRLHRMALHPDKFVLDDMSVLGELCESMVLLT